MNNKFKTPRDRYQNDPWYHNLVNYMANEISRCNYTPSEMREAAILACILYEENKMGNMLPIKTEKEAIKALETLHKYLDNSNV